MFRSELERVQLDTSTPGLKGSDRRQELIQRLVRHKLGAPTRRARSKSLSDLGVDVVDTNQTTSSVQTPSPRQPTKEKAPSFTADKEDECSKLDTYIPRQAKTHSSPTKRRFQQEQRAIHLVEEILSIRQQRLVAVEDSLSKDGESKLEDLERRLRQVNNERCRVMSECKPGSTSMNAHTTAIISGTLEVSFVCIISLLDHNY